jgi:hypothetical protein
LSVARTQADALVHLTEPDGRRSLCGRELRMRRPHKSFREAGCSWCRQKAIDSGRIAAREGDKSWINLLRV